MTDLSSLIQRLESQEPTSNDLTRLICDALGLDYGYDEGGNYGAYKIIGASKRFLESVDAAMTLIPSGHHWGIYPRYCEVATISDRLGDGYEVMRGIHDRPARALTIACLKVRTAIKNRMDSYHSPPADTA